MYPKSRKRRSEAQRRHDTLLHKSHWDPVAYQAATLEDMSETIKEQRERACVAEADAERNKKALSNAQNQVGPLTGTNRLEWEFREAHQVARLSEKLSSKESKINELLQAIDNKEQELQESTARCSELMGRVSVLHRDM